MIGWVLETKSPGAGFGKSVLEQRRWLNSCGNSRQIILCILWIPCCRTLNGATRHKALFQTSGQWIVVGWGSVNGIHGGEEDSRRELGVLIFFSGGVDLLRRPGPLKYGTQTNSGSISFTFRNVVPETGSRYSKARPEGVLVIFLDQSMPRAEYMVAPMSSM